MQFLVRGTVLAGVEALDVSISDLEIIQNGDAVIVLATSGPNGGLASYSLPGAGLASVVDTTLFNPNWAAGISTDLALVETTGGSLLAIVGATGATRLGGYFVDISGAISPVQHITGLMSGTASPVTLQSAAPGSLLLSDGGDGFAVYDVNGAGLTHLETVTDTEAAHVEAVGDLIGLTVGASEIVIATSTSEHGLTSYLDTGAGLVLADFNGPEQGLGIMTPTQLASAEVEGIDYVILGSTAGDNGALSVFQVASDGALIATDHILDTLDTRFGGVQCVETVTHKGITYVIAGGGDDGLSLFVLLPGGKLQFITAIEDSNAIGLQNVSAIAATVIGDEIRLLVASGREAGLTDLAIDLSGQGVQVQAGQNGAVLSGGNRNDVLVGGAGVDRIEGGAGDDIIFDGAGRDVMTGGAGRDLFILCDDGSEDIIVDFDPAFDRLDLSAWPMFHDPASLTIVSTHAGAEISWRGVKLMVRSASGQSLDPDDLRAAVLAGPNRPMDLTGLSFPNDRQYDLTGTDSADTIRGGNGGDTIAPGAGDDTIWAGSGNDTVAGGAGANTVYLQGGDDIYLDEGQSTADDGDQIFGGDGNDRIESGLGDDQIDGGTGNDLINSGGGNDIVEGGAGDDVVYLGSGNDRYTDLGGNLASGNDKVFGGTGHDTIYAGDGADEVYGEGGNDRLYGEAGNDRLFGGGGKDFLNGGGGNDWLKGDNGDDRLYGGAGNDDLFGGKGHDFLAGGVGDDVLNGGGGNDRLNGGAGHDRLIGGGGNDRLNGNGGNDTLLGGNGADHISGARGDDVLDGGVGADQLFGGIGSDTLFGGRGNDLLHGGQGNDLLTGGLGADTFVFSLNRNGRDRIEDFDPSLDRLVIDGATRNDVTLSQTADGLLLDWAGGSVLLAGLGPKTFWLSDIDFT